jgi:hypothetical protein
MMSVLGDKADLAVACAEFQNALLGHFGLISIWRSRPAEWAERKGGEFINGVPGVPAAGFEGSLQGAAFQNPDKPSAVVV